MRTCSDRLYARILLVYPACFRAEYGTEMEQLYRDCLRAAAGEGRAARARLWQWLLGDLARGAARERLVSINPAGRLRDTTPFTMEGPMILAVFTVVVGIMLGLGGFQELYVRGIVGNESEPFFIGLLGMATSLVMIAAGIGIMRGWSQRRHLMMVAALLNVFFLVYAALPPDRYVGWNALIMGVVMSGFLTARAYRLGSPAA
jgi:hypothetical protein